MPLFYFDVRDDGRLFPDEEGQEFPEVASAQREASEAAATIARDVLARRHGGEVTVQVMDEQREPVLTVTVEMKIARMK